MSIISHSQLQQCKRMLFVSPVALGDFLYLKTFLAAVKARYPHIELDLWLDDNRCNQDSWRLSRSKILQQWMQAEDTFTQTFGCTDSTQAMSKQVDQAKTRQYDMVVCHSVSKSKQFSKMARQICPNGLVVSSIPKSASAGIFNALLFRHSNHTYVLNEADLDKNHHITDRYNLIFNRIFGIELNKDQLMPNMVIPNEITPITAQWLDSAFTDSKEGKLIFLNHLSTNTKKDWHIDQLFELISNIAEQQPNNRFIINVTKENYQTVLEQTNQFAQASSIRVAVFTVNEHFFELPSLIAKADFVITVDTAILHFAFAAHRPLLAMMRTKKPYWAPPSTPQSKVLYATEGKGYVSDISVDLVYQQYLEMNN
ncbi:glycosyltransferase family 9 protein [Shewanella maritima]|uniref:glycosyltransferase family 9 protein n=1 Tax=Shewanella maritima TaxID=2520507 RepID=UPI0037352D08